MAYVKNKHPSYGGLSRAWGLGADAAAPSTAGTTAVAAGPGVIAAPPEATRQMAYPGYGYPGYGYPGHGYPGYPGYPMPMTGGVPTIMQAPAQASPAPYGISPGSVAVMRLPSFATEDRRRMFRRPRVKPQLARLGTIAAVAGVALLLLK